MMKNILGWMCVGLAATLSSPAGTIEEAGRLMMETHKDALVTVEVVLKVNSPRGSEEHEAETLGTMVHESGLVLVPARLLNPLPSTGEGVAQVSVSVSKVTLRWPDGTMVNAQQVFSDKDLDIAFVAPIPKAGQKMPPVKFVPMDVEAKVQALDQIILIGRQPKELNQEPLARIVRIEGTSRKPRFVYFPQALIGAGLPAFTADGKCFGIAGAKMLPSADMGPIRMGRNAPVIIPAADVKELLGPALDAAEKARNETAEKEKNSGATDPKKDAAKKEAEAMPTAAPLDAAA